MPLPSSRATGSQSPRHLPELKKVLDSLDLPLTQENKVKMTMDVVRKVAGHLSGHENAPFYSMREFQQALGVALRTVALAFEKLEAEGLLVRFQGSHTRLRGKPAQPSAPVRGIIGWLENLFILRNYPWRGTFSHRMGDAARSSHFVTDTILHWGEEDSDIDFPNRILSRRPDIVVWFQPTRPHRQTFDILKQSGIRNLIICDDEMERLNGQIIIDWSQAYAALLERWVNEHQISRLLMVSESGDGRYGGYRLEALARARGITVDRMCYTKDAPYACAREIPAGQAIALLDERSSVDFGQSPLFGEASRRHRILFARDLPHIPPTSGRPDNIDILCFPVQEMVEGIQKVFRYWQAGESVQLRIQGSAKFGETALGPSRC